MESCIFCKIANKEISSEIVSEDENFVVFKDINPKAPIHFLIIPKAHIGPVNTLKAEDKDIAGGLVLKAKEVAEKIGVSGSGYRLIFNVGKDAGMEVDHLHLHLLAGKPLKFES
ncbi:histidine triad nucleotide-binding protein [Candidatus Azambacteria bacterium]|nr:histidine triad nucleotide-binding protein [Candidatus Azambacteria bacterium]